MFISKPCKFFAKNVCHSQFSYNYNYMKSLRGLYPWEELSEVLEREDKTQGFLLFHFNSNYIHTCIISKAGLNFEELWWKGCATTNKCSICVYILEYLTVRFFPSGCGYQSVVGTLLYYLYPRRFLDKYLLAKETAIARVIQVWEKIFGSPELLIRTS